LFEADYEKQDKARVSKLAGGIMFLAAVAENKPVYYRTGIVPGERIKFGEESKADEPELCGKKVLLAKLDAVIRRRDKSLARLRGRETGR
jgi:hypothetical protein